MTSDITVNTPKGETPAVLVVPDDANKHPAIILIQEVWGMTPHIRNVAQRLAAEGYVVLAPDLIGPTGINKQVDQSILAEVHNPVTRDEAQKKLRAAMGPIMAPEFAQDTVARLQSCFEFLAAHQNSTGQVAVVGFCFGGTYAWSLAVAQPALAGAVAFYGQTPLDNGQLAKITCPVLAFYGEKDDRLVNLVPQIDKQMNDLGKTFEYKIYPNCGHAFFNDTNPVTFDQKAAKDSWTKTLDFLNSHFKA